MFLALFIEW